MQQLHVAEETLALNQEVTRKNMLNARVGDNKEFL
jgi:hypothetical protein